MKKGLSFRFYVAIMCVLMCVLVLPTFSLAVECINGVTIRNATQDLLSGSVVFYLGKTASRDVNKGETVTFPCSPNVVWWDNTAEKCIVKKILLQIDRRDTIGKEFEPTACSYLVEYNSNGWLLTPQ